MHKHHFTRKRAKALSVFNLRDRRQSEDYPELLNTVAKAVSVDPDELKAQFDDVQPRAVSEAAILAKTDSNKPSWREMMQKIRATPSVARNHPTHALREALTLYFVFGLSSSGVEQDFSKAGFAIGHRRQAASEATEESCLKAILDLPHHDRSQIIALARRVWVVCYGASRRGAPRVTKGVKRKARELSDGDVGMTVGTEQDFIHKRRQSISESLSADPGCFQPVITSGALMARASEGVIAGELGQKL